MAISFEYRDLGGDQPDAQATWSFGDDERLIRLGRDPQQCQVALLSETTTFGREHCRLIFQSGRYALETDSVHRVFWNDREVFSGETLDGEGRLRLGADGPVLLTRIVSRSRLPPTDLSARGENPAVTARRAESLSRRGFSVGIAVALAVVIGGIVTFSAFWMLRWQVRQASSRNELQDQRIAGTASKAAELSSDMTAQREAILQQQQQTQRAMTLASEAAMKPTPTNWVEVFDRAVPSIGLVMIRDAAGQVVPCATAWAVDAERRLFATNSHVGKLLDELPDSSTLIVRMAVPNVQDFEIVSATLHPGYDSFTRLWDNYAPVRPDDTGGEPIGSAGPACDVALLHAADGGPAFPPALRLADDSTLESLAAGQPLGSIGFPMEGLRLGGVNAGQPVPIRHLAYLAATTDYFGRPGDSQNPRHLVQHAIPSTGGASGSPILNQFGDVVAVHNAGNVIGLVNGVRVEASAMIFFAQRADLVRELLEDRANALQDQRMQAWTHALRTEFVPAARLLHPELLAEAKAECEASYEASELISATLSDIIQLQEKVSQTPQEDSDHARQWTFAATRSARYMAFASTENSNGAIAVRASTPLSADANEPEFSGFGTWYATCDFIAFAGEQVTLEVQVTEGDFPVRLEVFAADPGDYLVTDLADERIDDLRFGYDAEPVETVISQTSELNRVSGVGEMSLELSFEKPGTYLCAVVPQHFDGIKIAVRRPMDSPDMPWMTESRLGLSLGISCDIQEPTRVTLDVTVVDSEVCWLKVIRLAPESGPVDTEPR